jgi:hypothetical protein
MDKITLETDFLDQLEKASKFLGSLSTNQPVADFRSSKDISQSRMATKDISARRKPTDVTKVKPMQSVTDKIEQDLIKELVSNFE